jgi:hypothetical protein
MKRLLAALAFASVGLGAAVAEADTFGYCGFSSSNATSLTFNGSASRQGTDLQLTPNMNGQAGSAYRTAPVVWSTATSFSTSFAFELEPNAGGGDGISFIVQNSGVNAIGSNGGAIGYGRILGGGGLLGGISPSVEIEFDTFQNTWDPNANHVGIMRNGDNTTHIASASPTFTMANGGQLTAWIDYDAATTTIDVYLSLGATKPASPLVSATVNIGTTIGAQAFVGFTGGTGGNTNTEDVLEWQFSTAGEPCVCGGDAACGGSLPICDPGTNVCSSPTADAGSDASLESGTPDAGSDAEPDAAVEGGERDAEADGGASDAGAPDSSADEGAGDGESQDGAGDAAEGDSSTLDGGDATVADSGSGDSGVMTNTDAAAGDGAPEASADGAGPPGSDYGSPGSIEGGGCSCDLPGTVGVSGAGGLFTLLVGAMVVGRRRRRRRLIP